MHMILEKSRVVCYLFLASIVIVIITWPAATAPVKLTYMSWYTGASQDVELEIIRAFNASHPNIQVEKLSGDPRSKLVTLVAGGVGPDMSVMAHTSQAELITNLALDITPFILRDKFDFRQYLPFTVPPVLRDGRYYGIPWGYGELNFVYNKTAFEKNGLPLPYKGWLADDMLKAAHRLTYDADGDGQVDRYGIDPGYMGTQQPLLHMRGGKFVDEQGNVAVTRPEFYEPLQFVADLYSKDKVAVSVRSAGFIDQKVAMIADWPGYWGSMYIVQKVADKFDWRVTYWPRDPDSQTYSYGWGHTLTILKGSKYPEEAWEFLKFWGSQEAETILAKAALYPVTLQGARHMASIFNYPPGYKWQDLFAYLLEPPASQAYLPFDRPGFTQIFSQILVPVITTVLQGQQSAKTAMEAIAPVLVQTLADAQRK